MSTELNKTRPTWAQVREAKAEGGLSRLIKDEVRNWKAMGLGGLLGTLGTDKDARGLLFTLKHGGLLGALGEPSGRPISPFASLIQKEKKRREEVGRQLEEMRQVFSPVSLFETWKALRQTDKPQQPPPARPRRTMGFLSEDI